MGLLNDDLFELMRNAPQDHYPYAHVISGSRLPGGAWPRHAPFGLAGPSPMVDAAGSLAQRIGATSPLMQQSQGVDAPPAFLRDARGMPSDGSVGPYPQQPASLTQTLTSRIFQMKGIPEGDIAAAAGNPELTRQLANRAYSPNFAAHPVSGYSSRNDIVADDKKRYCLDRCNDLALPTLDYGINHQRCMLACMTDGNSGHSSWDRYFP